MPTMQRDAIVHTDLIERVREARHRSDALFDVVRPDALFDRPIPERHRLIFYVGHLEAFDWNLLHGSLPGLKSFHPEFDRLFAFGIDPVDGGLPSDQPSDWPSLKDVRDYVSRIRRALDAKLESDSGDAASGGRDGFPYETLLNVVVEHRLMHVETLAYLLHQLPLDRKIDQRSDRKIGQGTEATPVTHPATPRMVGIPAGLARLGLRRDAGKFGWDNEYEALEVNVPAFAIDQYKVTNGQYLEFVSARGYETRSLWDDENWQWKTNQGISHPVFWKKAGDQWLFRGMFEESRLPLDWPVYVSHAEAAAYALWADKALPTEEEWHRAAYGTEDDTTRTYPWGSDPPASHFGNFDFNHWNPTPVNAFPKGRSGFGVWDLLGNGWEWTSSQFAPFPGFEPFSFYRGYSADFFDGKHFVMKGGSSRTARCMLRASFRNWFQPYYQYVYAGFRCVSR
jgi:gamma-glutamyl hercynylcysteine S-oxide synthase